MHFVDFHFSEFFVQSSDLSVPAELYAGREGSREGETKCLTLPGNSPALMLSFCIYSPPPTLRKTGPPENRLQLPPPPPPCLAGFFLL